MRSFILACLFTLAALIPQAWSATPSTPCIIDGTITTFNGKLVDDFVQQMWVDSFDPSELIIDCTVHSNNVDLTGNFYQLGWTITRGGVEVNDAHVISVTFVPQGNSAILKVDVKMLKPTEVTLPPPYMLAGELQILPPTKK